MTTERLREDVGNLLNTPCDCGESWTGRGRHAPDCRWRFIHDFLDDDEIAAVLDALPSPTDADLYDRILATITEQLGEQGLPDANPSPLADGVWEILGHGFSDEVPRFERESDKAEPSAVVSRDLLLRAVDLRAVAWNALCAVPAHGGSWERFWRKLHELRESVNRPEHEDIRIAYASTFPDGPTKRDDHRVLDEHWNIVPSAPATPDTEAKP